MHSPTKPTLLTGIQSSGKLHLGSYLGTITQWQDFFQSHRCYFCIADLHAITVKQDPQTFRTNSLEMAAWLLACGLDPKVQVLFLQSQVRAHTELGWIFSCLTPMGELNRMTQFKEKSNQKQAHAHLGLYAYPCLMAADILLYNSTHVPVGHDQKQHLELARNIAERFNRDYGQTFNLPEPYIHKTASRVMSLQAPENKMSKSDKNEKATIFMMDDEKTVLKKIKKAVTDTDGVVAYDKNRPAIANLVQIYAKLNHMDHEQVEKKYQGLGYGVFKTDLAELISQTLAPIQERYKAISEDQSYLRNVLVEGAKKANDLTKKKLNEVKRKMGFVVYD